MSRDLQTAHDRWNELGETDPLWSVLTEADKTGGRWSEDDFLTSGHIEVQGLMEDLAAAGLSPAREVVLDFGCGVGRLTQALTAHFDRAIGVDVAPSMIEWARQMDRTGGRASFVLNRSNRLEGVPPDSVDLVYSNMVLQHVSPALSRGYVAEFLRVLRPGGIAVFQLPSRPKRARGYLKLWLKRMPRPLLAALLQATRAGRGVPIDMHGVPRTAVEATVRAAGGEVVGVIENDAAGPDWTSWRYTVRKHAPSG
ncbi:MAG: class I SAM-dependent methyltransferase [Chloroflexota bacterium]